MAMMIEPLTKARCRRSCSKPFAIAVGELEPEFEGLEAVARELETRLARLIWCLSIGWIITLVETRLWRSPEAPVVVAQIIDYVKEVAR